MITREQVADLRVGDVVEYSSSDWPHPTFIRGPVYLADGCLHVGGRLIRFADGDVTAGDFDNGRLTVVSRPPRPLYVNHDRTEPAEGDIVRDCDGDSWRFERDEWWCASADACDDDDPDGLPLGHYRPLTLLWDGETGQVVP